MRLKFFIAYETYAGGDIARNLKKSLEKYKGYVEEAFVAEADMPIGEKEEKKFRFEKIENADYFVLIYTPNCLAKSSSLKEEVEKAKEVEKSAQGAKNNFILLCRYKNAKIEDEELEKRQWFLEFKTPEEAARKFDEDLPKLLQIRGKYKLAEKAYNELHPGQKLEEEVKKEALISVVIPYRDNKEVLELCLECLSNQTQPPNEIVIISDHSTEPIELIEKYKKKMKNTSFIYEKLPDDPLHKERRALARQIGTYLSKCRYILYLDQDTLLAQGTIENLLKYASYSLVVFPQGYKIPEGMVKKDEILKYIKSSPENRCMLKSYNYGYGSSWNIVSNLLNVNWNFVPFNCILINKLKIKEIGYFDIRYEGYGEEDADIKYRLKKSGVNFMEIIIKDCASYHFEMKIGEEETKRRKEEWIRNAIYFLKKSDLGEEDMKIREEIYKSAGIWESIKKYLKIFKKVRARKI